MTTFPKDTKCQTEKGSSGQHIFKQAIQKFSEAAEDKSGFKFEHVHVGPCPYPLNTHMYVLRYVQFTYILNRKNNWLKNTNNNNTGSRNICQAQVRRKPRRDKCLANVVHTIIKTGFLNIQA